MAHFITSLEQILAPGVQFPPPGEVQTGRNQKLGRLDRMAQNKRLWDGEHDQAYGDWGKVARFDDLLTAATQVELMVNFHRRLSRLWKSLMLSEPPTIKVDDAAQPWCDDLMKKGRLVSALGSDVLDMSRFGVGLLKAVKKDGQPAKIVAQPPLIGEAGDVAGGWFPIVDPFDVTEITGHVVAWIETRREQVLGVPVNRRYCHAQVFEPGRFVTQTWVMSGKVLKTLIAENVTTLPEGVMLLHPAQNGLTSDSIYGTDDYRDIDGLIHEVEIRMSQISAVLDKHADPNLQGPNNMVTGGTAAGHAAQAQANAQRGGGMGQATVKIGGKFFGRLPDEAKIEYITWDGNLEASFREIDTIMDLVYLLSETSPAAFALFKQAQAESGSALKRLMMAPLLKVADMRNSLDEALMAAIYAAAALDGVTITTVEVEWKDGLPQDRAEDATIETAMFGAKLRSKEAAIRAVYGLEGDALKDELKAIDGDQPKAPAPPTPDQIVAAARAGQAQPVAGPDKPQQ